jgi:DNA-binding response OmpR family regulator
MATIMVVDDEEDILSLIQKILTKEGHTVITARDGKEALEKLKHVKPDLILLDIMMPGMSGYQVCKIIKQSDETSSITVAMLTVKADDEDKIRALEDSRADWYFTKPIDTERFAKSVEWLLKNPPRRG